MSNSSNIIDISSDSETEFVIASESSSEASGWAGYFPPWAASTSSKKSTKKTTNPAPDARPAPFLEFYSSSSDDDADDETYSFSKDLPRALTKALETSLSNMKQISIPEKPARLPRPPLQVLGLACPRMQSTFENKRKRAQKNKHDYQGKGKKPME